MTSTSIRYRSEIEFYRVRRTLSQVKGKFEEALRLSRREDEKRDERPTITHRNR